MTDSVMLGAVVSIAGIYTIGNVRLRARTEHASRLWKTISGFVAFAVLVVLELPRFHHLGQDLFTFHMTGHILLAGIAAPFLILAEPVAPMLWCLPREARSVVGRLILQISKQMVLVLASKPMAATALHALALWAWHVPILYNMAVRDELAHWLQHASFFITALFFWSAVFRNRNVGISIIILLITLINTGMLGALLTFSPVPWYHGHEPENWGLTPLEDQQLAGLVMWVPASFIYVTAALALGASLLQEPAKRSTRHFL